jgi:hypothetical protein
MATRYHSFNASEIYAIEQVYVPVYHPEVKNYTMYYEASQRFPSQPLLRMTSQLEEDVRSRTGEELQRSNIECIHS